MVGVPPEYSENVLASDSPNPFDTAQTQRHKLVNIILVQLDKAILSSFAKLPNWYAMVAVFALDRNFIPGLAFKMAELFPNLMGFRTVYDMPSERVNSLHEGNMPGYRVLIITWQQFVAWTLARTHPFCSFWLFRILSHRRTGRTLEARIIVH